MHLHHERMLEQEIDKVLTTVAAVWGSPEVLVARYLNMQAQAEEEDGKAELTHQQKMLDTEQKNQPEIAPFINTAEIEQGVFLEMMQRTVGEFMDFVYRDPEDLPHRDVANRIARKVEELDHAG